MLLVFLFQAQFLPAHSQGTVRRVPGDYSTIQQAVDAAEPFDTIEVSAGVYCENVFVEKSLTFRGQDKYNTTVDGNGTGHAFWLMQSNVTISGFTIRNGNYCGVKAEMSGGHFITDNILSNNPYGVYLYQTPSSSDIIGNTFQSNSILGIKLAGSSNNNITNNRISHSTYGIKLDDTSEYNSIADNSISETKHGIYVGYSSNNNIDQNNVSSQMTGICSVYSDYNNIRNNTVSECANGIELYGTSSNLVFGNTLAQNGEGIFLVWASSNTVDSNLASNNGWGLATYDSDSNDIIQNTVSYNTFGIEIASYSTGNTIALNNIIENAMQVHQDTTSWTNTWYKSISGTEHGNYWSNYNGEDTNGDGVGDTHLFPHEAVDDYPLMQPWSTVHDVATLSVVPSDDAVYQGQVVNITVVVRNEGTVNETFNVAAKYFNLIIETKTVTNLARYESTTLVFSWNTTGVPTGFNYEISAEASTILGETDKLDNTFIDGTVEVSKEKLIGDINDDGTVNVDDLILLSQAYGSTSQSPNWNPNADLNGDNTINKTDLSLLTSNYGKTAQS